MLEREGVGRENKCYFSKILSILIHVDWYHSQVDQGRCKTRVLELEYKGMCIWIINTFKCVSCLDRQIYGI